MFIEWYYTAQLFTREKNLGPVLLNEGVIGAILPPYADFLTLFFQNCAFILADGLMVLILWIYSMISFDY